MASRNRKARQGAGRSRKGLLWLSLLAILIGGILLGALGSRLVDPTVQRKAEGIGGKGSQAATAGSGAHAKALESSPDLFNPFPDEQSAYRPGLDYEEEHFGASTKEADIAPIEPLPPAQINRSRQTQERAAPDEAPAPQPRQPDADGDLPAIY